jgi:hypothetical protein
VERLTVEIESTLLSDVTEAKTEEETYRMIVEEGLRLWLAKRGKPATKQQGE